MTSDVGEQFVLLAQAADEVAGHSVLTRPLGVSVGAGEVLIGIDADGLKHLLIPVAERGMPEDYGSAGVALRERVLEVGGDPRIFADLCCLKPTLDLVFERLVEDVVARLGRDASDPVRACRSALDEWRELLRTAGQAMPRDAVVGLIGELEVLRLLARDGPVEALAAWKGPDAGVHDFAKAGAALEVKSTSSVDGNFVSISNLDQLDPSLVDELYLLVVHLRQDEAAPSLEERIDELLEIGLERQTLIDKVADAGYVYEAELHQPDRYAVRSVRAWRVSESFPGLRRSDLGERRLRGVGNIRYELALDAAPPRLDDDSLRLFLDDWLGD